MASKKYAASRGLGGRPGSGHGSGALLHAGVFHSVHNPLGHRGRPVYGFGPGHGQILHGKKRGNIGGVSSPPGKKRPFDKNQVLHTAIGELRNVLMAKGFNPTLALNYSRLMLNRPGVSIGQKKIVYQGRGYNAADFADTHLANYVTGELAKRRNEAAIKAEPGYLAALSQLGLQRDLNTSGLDEQRRRAILDSGMAGFAGSDALLAAQAAANPLSTSALLARQLHAGMAQNTYAASQAGTLFGGAATAGAQRVQTSNNSQNTEATRSVQDLLNSYSQQLAQSNQIYGQGKNQALQDAQQRLIQSGALHAYKPPVLAQRKYRYHLPSGRIIT